MFSCAGAKSDREQKGDGNPRAPLTADCNQFSIDGPPAFLCLGELFNILTTRFPEIEFTAYDTKLDVFASKHTVRYDARYWL